MATIQRERFASLNHKNGGENGGNVGQNVGDMSVVELSERQKTILKIVEANPYITAMQMSVKMSVVKRTIERDLSTLKKHGLLVREGGSKNGRWIIHGK